MLDVQQIIPLPEASSFIVSQKIKAAGKRESARKFNFDFSLYDLSVSGERQSGLVARRLVFAAVSSVIKTGVEPADLSDLLPGGGRWLCVDGDCSAEQFAQKASHLRRPSGGQYGLNRYFCKDHELFRADGNTYALSNQWVHETAEEAVERIKEKYPALKISYTKVTE